MYITNKDGYYFEVAQNVDVTKLNNCKIHATEKQMLEYVLELYPSIGDSIEDLIDATIYIKDNYAHCGWTTFDITDEADSVENYINDFVM